MDKLHLQVYIFIIDIKQSSIKINLPPPQKKTKKKQTNVNHLLLVCA